MRESAQLGALPEQAGHRRRRGGDGAQDGPTPGSPADLTPDADPESVAQAICLRQLTLGPRSRAQLAAALSKRGVAEHVAETVLTRLEDVRLVDDEAFAETFVRSQRATRSLGSRALVHELRKRGVADTLVDNAVAAVDPDEELASAKALVARGLRSMDGLTREAKVRRLSGMLARKGYPSGVVARAVRGGVDDIDAALDDDLSLGDS
jgi:regulatory protein